jgi:ASPIC and UnbV
VSGGRSQMRELRSGSTYQSQNALELHFGLGETTTIESIQILWLGGEKNRMKDLQADQTLTIKEPAEATSRPSSRTPPRGASARAVQFESAAARKPTTTQ